MFVKFGREWQISEILILTLQNESPALDQPDVSACLCAPCFQGCREQENNGGQDL
jgi:hypothetical protein